MGITNKVGYIEHQSIRHHQKETLDLLQRGEIEDLRVSQKLPVDQIVEFGLEEGFLQEGFKSFPDPRANWEVPIEALLLPQVLQRLNDEHSLLLAPYMLNNADLITKLGYNIKVLKEGFNSKNVYPRKTAFHGDTLKHLLLGVKPEQIEQWFNQKLLPIWRRHSPGRTKQYILDATKIEVPSHLYKKYQQAGCVKNDDDTYSYGYKAVWLQEIIDNKGIIVALKIVPINMHDLEAARGLVNDFLFEDDATLIMDRGFIDGAWISELKKKRSINVFIPLRHNMDVTQAAITMADNRNSWINHPTRDGQKIAEFTADDGGLFWKECLELKTGVLVRWKKKDGTNDEVLFVTTKSGQSAKKILATYDQRAEIEESHRQLKENQGLEKLLSKKLTHVFFRVIMGVFAFNLMNLFLNSEQCKDFKEFSLKSIRQKRIQEENPKVTIYTKTTFAIVRLFEFLPTILELPEEVRKKLSMLFKTIEYKGV